MTGLTDHNLKTVSAGLAVCSVLTWGFLFYLQSGEGGYEKTRQSLDMFPLVLDARLNGEEQERPLLRWEGRSHPAEPLLAMQVEEFASQYLYRFYRVAKLKTGVDLYMVYSHNGKDRYHHPEVCMREVAGALEDVSGQRVIQLESQGGKPVQRFRFVRGNGMATIVYYWHYTFPLRGEESLDALQFLYQRGRQSPPSLTVQAMTRGSGEQIALVEQSFLLAIDQALRQRVLPKGARMACDRIPVTVFQF